MVINVILKLNNKRGLNFASLKHLNPPPPYNLCSRSAWKRKDQTLEKLLSGFVSKRFKKPQLILDKFSQCLKNWTLTPLIWTPIRASCFDCLDCFRFELQIIQVTWFTCFANWTLNLKVSISTVTPLDLYDIACDYLWPCSIPRLPAIK